MSDDDNAVYTISVPCQHCGELAAMYLTDEQARDYATALMCALDGIPPILVVEGEDDQED